MATLEIFKKYSKKANPGEPDRTGYLESFVTIHPILFSVFLRTLIFVQFPNLLKRNKIRVAIEHLIFFTPLSIFCFEMIFSDDSYLYFILIYDAVLIFMTITKMYCLKNAPIRNIIPSTTSDVSIRSSSASSKTCGNTIRMFRGTLYIATVICILARDLNGFRIRFSKAFYRGTGLMDVGVGFFLFLMGLTGPTARMKSEDFTREKKRMALISCMKWVIILLAIGVATIVVEKAVDHIPNPSEYGVSWNVFITLGLLKFVGTIIELVLCQRCPPVLLAIIISSAMEVLQAKGLKLYVFYAERSDFFSSNREGIVQCAGLLALYLWGLQIGKFLFDTLSLPSSQCCPSDRLQSSPRFKFLTIVGVTFFITVTGSAVLKWMEVIEKESRCLANFAYVLWIVAFCTCVLIVFVVADFVANWMQDRLPNDVDLSLNEHLLQRIDRNGFVFFIIGNLLTGLYSVSFLPQRSLQDLFKGSSAGISVLILVTYCSLTTTFAFSFVKLPQCLRKVCAFFTRRAK